jgi:phenylpropionate dioxygenase-like ring-hydroxylating dioxygenase large terminal subunit
MYINFWYPMATTDELESDVPMKVRCLGLDFVLFRDSAGQANCLANTCTHRGGSLAGGKVKGDCIQCPYHGWQFNGSGQCQKIPSLGPDANIPSRTGVDAYPVEEKWGLIFAFLGDLPAAERPPLLDITEYGQDGWRATMQTFEIQGNYQRSVENGLDPAHNEFVHDTHGFQGENEAYKVNEMRIEERDEWGRGFWHTFNSPPLPEGDMRELRDYAGDLEAGTGHHGPNQLWTFIHVDPKNHFHQYGYERPIDDENAFIYLVTMRNCMLDTDKDDFMKERNAYVAAQDQVIIESLHPIHTPETNNKEYMTPSDQVIVMYRDKLTEWDRKGWRIDFDTLQQTSRNVAYAIPGPTRREQKGWVLDEVPLMEPANRPNENLKATG